MSETFLSTVAAITLQLNRQKRDRDKLGILARSLRWHDSVDAADLAALLTMGELAQRKSGAGCWEVERAVLEIMCIEAGVEHVPFLIDTFRHKAKGQHSNDRRRLALQALSKIGAHTGHKKALRILEEGLRHYKKDTRGWAIGFLLDSYAGLGRPLPQSVIERLQHLAENDVSSDVRVEAALALANLGLAGAEVVAEVGAKAQEQANRGESH